MTALLSSTANLIATLIGTGQPPDVLLEVRDATIEKVAELSAGGQQELAVGLRDLVDVLDVEIARHRP